MRDRSFFAAVRSVAVLAACTLTVWSGAILTGCSRTPTVDDYIAKSGIDKLVRLRIAVFRDSPLLGEADSAGRYSGFDIEIARYIAHSLGFNTVDDQGIQWVPTTVENRERLLVGHQVDLVVATYSITEERKKTIRFAGPYLITSQEMMIQPSLLGKVRNLADVQDQQIPVCLPGVSTSEANLAEYKVKTIANVTATTCMDGLETGEYKIFSTDEVVLAGYNARHGNKFPIVDVTIKATEEYGIGMARDAPELQALVEHYLMKSYTYKGFKSPWQEAWDKTLGQASWNSPLGKEQPKPEVSQVLRDSDDRSRAANPVALPGAFAARRFRKASDAA